MSPYMTPSRNAPQHRNPRKEKRKAKNERNLIKMMKYDREGEEKRSQIQWRPKPDSTRPAFSPYLLHVFRQGRQPSPLSCPLPVEIRSVTRERKGRQDPKKRKTQGFAAELSVGSVFPIPPSPRSLSDRSSHPCFPHFCSRLEHCRTIAGRVWPSTRPWTRQKERGNMQGCDECFKDAPWRFRHAEERQNPRSPPWRANPPHYVSCYIISGLLRRYCLSSTPTPWQDGVGVVFGSTE